MQITLCWNRIPSEKKNSTILARTICCHWCYHTKCSSPYTRKKTYILMFYRSLLDPMSSVDTCKHSFFHKQWTTELVIHYFVSFLSLAKHSDVLLILAFLKSLLASHFANSFLSLCAIWFHLCFVMIAIFHVNRWSCFILCHSTGLSRFVLSTLIDHGSPVPHL